MTSWSLFGIAFSTSRSMTPLPRWIAPAMCPLLHSLSSRTSTRVSFSPASMRFLTSATLVSLTRDLASLTMARNPGACCMVFLRSHYFTTEARRTRRRLFRNKKTARGERPFISREAARRRTCAPRLLCRRSRSRGDDAVHAQVFDHLSIVVLRMAQNDDGEAEPRPGPRAERVAHLPVNVCLRYLGE